ncbi:hypothetical protein DEO72_LG8g651 [Vigna unguiculata]|uniref:Uncharacterized protein n=1 Tax=Vigna unguiculata TaxID=3917 RepID=A0A4D6MMB7_VIGUN|nr:hypothetical protein DEO72_LG8g651 [Vigna unguiculata]
MKLGGEGKIRAESGKRKLGLWFDDRGSWEEEGLTVEDDEGESLAVVEGEFSFVLFVFVLMNDGGNNDKEVHSKQPDGGDKVVDPELQDDANNETCKDGMEDDGNNPNEVGYDKVDGGDKDRMDDDVQGDMEGRHDEGVDDVEVHSWTESEPDIADAIGDQELEGLVDVNVAYDGDATHHHNLCEGSVEVDLYFSEGSQESEMGLSDNEWVSDHLDSGEESEDTPM